jgi:transporter family-2 protein
MYIALAVAAGIGLAFQAVINSRLRMVLDSALWAAFVQVLLGLLLLAVLVAIAREPVPSGAGLSRAPWWVWTGGMLGALYVATVIVATPALGASLMFAAVVVGQTLTALLIDHFGWFGVPVQPLSPLRLAGAALLVGGVALIRLR